MTDTAWPTVVGAAPPFASDPQRACVGISTSEFYPARGGRSAEIRTVKRVCRTCPLMAACRDWAIDNFEQGIWGATTDRERLRIRSQRERGQAHRHAAARRAQVVALDAQQLSAKEIAARLGVDERTVCRYRAQLRAGAAA